MLVYWQYKNNVFSIPSMSEFSQYPANRRRCCCWASNAEDGPTSQQYCVYTCLSLLGLSKYWSFPAGTRRWFNKVNWWSTVYDVARTSNQLWFNVLCLLGSWGYYKINPYSQQTQLNKRILVQWWISVVKVSPTFDQHWFKVINPMLIYTPAFCICTLMNEIGCEMRFFQSFQGKVWIFSL